MAAGSARRDGEVAELFAAGRYRGARPPLTGRRFTAGKPSTSSSAGAGDHLPSGLGPVRGTADGTHAAVPMQVEVSTSGTALELDTVHVFHCDVDGLIAAMHSF